MDNRTRKKQIYYKVKDIFKAEKDIKMAVLEAKTAKRKELCGGSGQSYKSDPTAMGAVRHLTEVPVIHLGAWFIHRPEDWLKVIAATYDISEDFDRALMVRYFRKGEKVSEMVKPSCGFSESAAYAALDNFITTGMLIACQFGLVRVVDA